MSRRASLPGASELFRRTSSPVFADTPVVPDPAPAGNGHGGSRSNGDGAGSAEGSEPGRGERQLARSATARRGSGRQKHDAKITVYVSGEELLAMEHARLTLRGSHDLAVDRGRIVREAVAVLLADFDQHGEDSVLVRRLRDGQLAAEEAAN
ncbi:cobyrinic acid a,c-diamide synthase [Prauserella sp. PE36]|uniref:Cobyrinic acid a,c-diamide synthase n=1 Tax=Prauserella endophytica TaxID=1592324 RepID=A0ABY2RTI4_9PSEU|nr:MULTISPECIES: cobyrinic acid a,c-diamide synthase [Prauserella]RBM13361.1 cobyrinic acid a,c-diamide synthase [Prauserella sp. PE36]TKG60038.1 cobyrinic acid a,c-diamide synthase [Prauserella endophytica]